MEKLEEKLEEELEEELEEQLDCLICGFVAVHPQDKAPELGLTVLSD